MKGWGLPWLLWGLANAAIGPGTDPPVRIEANAPFSRELSSGEVHFYRLALDEGEYARLEVIQQGLDVATLVRGPSGAEVIKVDTLTGRFSTEKVSFIAQEKGEYVVEVSPAFPSDTGKYRLTVAALHQADQTDRLRVLAEWASLKVGRNVEAGRRALELWTALGDRFQEARAQSQLGRALTLSNQMEEAISRFTQAVSVQRELNDREGLAETLGQMGRTFSLVGDDRQALEALQESIAIWQELGRLDSAVTILLRVGKMHQDFGDADAAIAAYEQSLELSRKMGDKARQADSLNSRGQMRKLLGQPFQALEDLKEALELAHSTGRPTPEILSNLGSLYQDLGMPHDALEHYAKAREILHGLKDPSEAIALNNLGSLLLQLGALEQARELLSQALPRQRDPRNEAMTRVSLSRIAEELGEFEEAESQIGKALKLQRAAKDRAGEAESLRALGLLLLETGDAAQAELRLRESLAIYEDLGRVDRAAASRRGLARAFELQKKTDAARQAYEESRRQAETLGDVAAQAVTLADQGRLEHALGNLPAARAHLEAALDRMESFRSEVGGDRLRALHFATVRETYERYVDVLMQLHRKDPKAGLDARAFEVAEQSRARGLLDVLARAQVDTREGDPALMGRELRLRQELNAKAALRLTLSDDEASRASREALDREVEALTTEHRIMEALLTKGSSYESLKKPSIAVSDIQALLDPQTVLLEYLLGELRSYLWVVTPTSLKAFELPGRQEIAKRARSLHEHLKDPAERDVAGQRSDLRLLSKDVLGPALGEIADRRLLIVPDGALHYVPFAALPVPSREGRTVFLVEEHEIVFLPSAAVLKEIRRAEAGRPDLPASIAVVADPVYDGTQTQPRRVIKEISRGEGLQPLPWTQQEADDIAAVAQGRKILLYTGHRATRQLVMSGELQPFRALHFATHGILDSEHPEQSGLVLSQLDPQGRPIDGFLSLQDLYSLRLQANLVVLSGCDTGLGGELRGEGLVGLTHGFLHAGASQVVASLWPIRDRASAELMQRFYGSMLRDGLRPAAALRAAQIGMLNQPNMKDPYFWAAFVAQGDWITDL